MSSSRVTWWMTLGITCSLLELAVGSSAITVRKGDFWRSEDPSPWEFHFESQVLCTHSPFMWATLLCLDPQEPSFRGAAAHCHLIDLHLLWLPALACWEIRVLKESGRVPVGFCIFWAACCIDSCSPMSRKVDGSVTTTSTAACWEALHLSSCWIPVSPMLLSLNN